MVSGADVRGDWKSVGSEGYLGKYDSQIGSLSGSWEGASYNKLKEQAAAFVKECAIIGTGMEAFASACDDYATYKSNKDYIEKEQARISDILKNDKEADVSAIEDAIKAVQDENDTLAKSIRENLEIACSTKIEGASGIIYAPGVDGGKLYISSKNGYVFPIEAGVYAPVTSSVGFRTPPKAGATSNHQGTDIGVSTGTKVHSLCDGEIVAAGFYGGYGNRVEVKQSDGSTVIYAHLSKSDYYNVGDKVQAGDTIALSGNTGNSTGPHLHLEIHDKDGYLVDSEKLFNNNGKWPGNNA